MTANQTRSAQQGSNFWHPESVHSLNICDPTSGSGNIEPESGIDQFFITRSGVSSATDRAPASAMSRLTESANKVSALDTPA